MATVALTHTVSCGITHTQCAPLLLLGKHRCDNLARTRLSAAYPAWPTWQMQWCVPAAHPRLRVVEVHVIPKEKVTNGQIRWSRGPLAEHLVILSSAASPSVWQVLVEKRADSEMPVRRRPILLKKVAMSLSEASCGIKFWFYNYLESRSIFVFTLYTFWSITPFQLFWDYWP